MLEVCGVPPMPLKEKHIIQSSSMRLNVSKEICTLRFTDIPLNSVIELSRQSLVSFNCKCVANCTIIRVTVPGWSTFRLCNNKKTPEYRYVSSSQDDIRIRFLFRNHGVADAFNLTYRGKVFKHETWKKLGFLFFKPFMINLKRVFKQRKASLVLFVSIADFKNSSGLLARQLLRSHLFLEKNSQLDTC